MSQAPDQYTIEYIKNGKKLTMKVMGDDIAEALDRFSKVVGNYIITRVWNPHGTLEVDIEDYKE